MLRRPTRSPETLLYASESPAGAGPSWWTRTSLVAQTARHASVAEVAQEAVARARIIPEDVRLVTPKVVADDGVVPGLRRSSNVRIDRDHDPARDGGGARGDVARDLIARNLHATRAKKRDADPREIPIELCRSTRARIVLDRVAFHLEVIYGLRRESFEEHARAVVVDRVSGEGAAVGVADVDAPRAARDAVADDLGVVVGPFRPEDGDARIAETAHIVGDDLGARRIEDSHAAYGAVRDVVGDDLGAGRFVGDDHAKPVAYEIVPLDGGIRALLSFDPLVVASSYDVVHDLGARTDTDQDALFGGFRAAYNMVLRDSAVDAPAKGDPSSEIACDTVSHNSSVASGENVDHGSVLVLEPPDREAGNAHIAHALVDLFGFGVKVAEDANSLRSESLRAGRVCFGSGGRFDHGVLSPQLDPVLEDHHVLSVNSPHDYGVAWIGSVYGLLYGFARPNDRAIRDGGSNPHRQSQPACHQQG